MVELADLATWTPIALNLTPVPTIDWCNLEGIRYDQPFFDQNVPVGPDVRPIVRTDLDALLALELYPSVEPSGLIFHLSRCGSTLVSRALGAVPGTVVISEAGIINSLLQADPKLVHEEVRVRVLRLLVRALGRIRFGDERRLVLKFSSWNVRRAATVQAAFPDIPVVWVQRPPAEVMASLLAGAPGWVRLMEAPRDTEHLFGIPQEQLGSLDRAAFCARALEAMLRSAAATCADVVDYRDLPAAIWDRVAPLFGMALDDPTRAAMSAEALYSAKEPGRVPFKPQKSAAILPQGAAELVQNLLDPLYRSLDARRAAPRV